LQEKSGKRKRKNPTNQRIYLFIFNSFINNTIIYLSIIILHLIASIFQIYLEAENVKKNPKF